MTKITKVSTWRFANSYIVSSDAGAILIDTGLPGCEKAILKTCRQQNITLNLIVITHGHLDHMGSAAALKRETGAQVAIHVDDASALQTGISKMDKPVGLIPRAMPFFMGSVKTEVVEPDILIKSECTLADHGIDGRILMTPGHTSGSISVILGNGEAFTGDLIMGGFFGKIRSRHPNLPPFEIGRDVIKASVQHLLEQNPRTIYPSHGGPFKPEDVIRWAHSL